MNQNRTDAQLIQRSLSEPECFMELFNRHFDCIHRYLHRRVGRDLADELSSQAFTEAFASRGRFDGARGDSALPWLYGIAANMARKKRREEVRQLKAYASTGLDSEYVPAADALLTRLDAESYGHKLAEALAALTAREREVLTLYALADLTYGEIGAALGISMGSVCTLLSRARKKSGVLLVPVKEYLDAGIAPKPAEEVA